MTPVTTHQTKHPRAGIRPLGGALWGVIPDEGGHVSLDLKAVHDALANDLVESFRLSHASIVASCIYSDQVNKVATYG